MLTGICERNWLTSVINRDSTDAIISAYYYNDYDDVGNRLQKTEVRGQATETTKYINDVGAPLVQVLMEMNEEDTPLATYTYGNDLISKQPITS